MIKLITLVLQFSLPILDFIFKRSAKKDDMKRKMFELMKKYDTQVMQNAKLRSEYEELKKKFEQESMQ